MKFVTKKKKSNQIIIYRAKNGAIELKSDIENNPIWATQEQIADVFGIERSVVTKFKYKLRARRT